MKTINAYILEKLKITKSPNKEYKLHEEYKLYKRMCEDLYLDDDNFDGLCIVAVNKRSKATTIFAQDDLSFNSYRELIEDIYEVCNMVTSKWFHLCPIKNNNPLDDYVIFSSKWIDTDMEFYRDYFEKLFFGEN